jgi:pyruvyltransferase
VVYPTGLVILKDKVFISAGINDSELALFIGSLEDLSYRMISTQVSEIKELHRADKQLVAPMSVPPIEPRVPLFWWYAKGSKMNLTISPESFKFGNFGDDASVLLVDKLLGFAPRKSMRDEKKLLAVGSILHLASEGDIVWGSGLKSDEALDEHPGGNILVTAVRGPRTLKVLERAGWDTSHVRALFDPGVLLRHVFAQRLAEFNVSSNDKFGKIRIVPHFKDDLVFRRMYPELIQHFVSADNDPLRVLESMLGAEVVISSSLHGIIFAESLGIPAIWVESPGGEAHFKYLDYYEGTGRFGIEPAKSVLEALKIQPPALPEFDFDSLLATFPKDEITGLARARMPYTEREMIGIKARRTHREDFEHSRSKSITLRNGLLWIRGKRGTIALAPLDIEKEYSAVKVTMIPARMRISREGFKVKVCVEDGACTSLSWPKGSSIPKVVQLPVSKEMWNNGLKVSIESNSVGIGGPRTSLKNWGLSVLIDSVGAAIPD